MFQLSQMHFTADI